MNDNYKPSVRLRVALCLLSLCIFLLIASCGGGTLKGEITVKVVDESGLPLEGVSVSVGYQSRDSSGTKVSSHEGLTDSDGKFASTGWTSGHVTFSALMEGYYRSSGSYDFISRSGFSWDPSNPSITLVLRKIKNPVPMYARDTGGAMLEVPVVGKDVGFDLIVGDWIEPYGKGTVADFIFNMDRDYITRDENSGVLNISFSNKYDGIKGFNDTFFKESVFKTAYVAPSGGYQSVYQKYVSRNDGKYISNVNKEINHVFRVRSELKDGQFYRGMYGKINGDIIFDIMGSETASVSFRYFLNPDYSRNLEFDPERNLFQKLSSLEEVWLH